MKTLVARRSMIRQIEGGHLKAIVELRREDSKNEISITGEETDRRGRVVSCGCLHEEIGKVFPELAPYLRWHMNTLRPECEHQRVAGILYRPHPYGSKEYDACGYKTKEGCQGCNMGKPCEVCGYRLGFEWKYEPIPDDVIRFLGLFGDLEK